MTSPAKIRPADHEYHTNYLLVTRLCKTGLRPPAIRTMVSPIIPEERIYSIYRMMTGHNPPQGQLPTAVEHALNSPRKRVNATAVLLMNHSYRSLPIEERFLRVFYAYSALMQEEALFDATRVWSLCRWSAGDMVRLAHCCKCGSASATSHKSLRISAHCPFCAIAPNGAEAQSKTKVIATRKVVQAIRN